MKVQEHLNYFKEESIRSIVEWVRFQQWRTEAKIGIFKQMQRTSTFAFTSASTRSNTFAVIPTAAPHKRRPCSSFRIVLRLELDRDPFVPPVSLQELAFLRLRQL